jgi:hypothetical protein
MRNWINGLRNAERHARTGLVVAWAVAVSGWLILAATPNVYEATARIYLDIGSLSAASAWVDSGFTPDMPADEVVSKAYSVGKPDRSAASLAGLQVSDSLRWNNVYVLTARNTDPQRARATVREAVLALEAALSPMLVETTGTAPAAFRIVEPVAERTSLVSPRRGLWTLLIVLASLLTGMLSAFVLGSRSPLLTASPGMRTWGGVAVIGVIRHMRMDEEMAVAQANRLRVAIAASVLIVAAIAVWLLQRLFLAGNA